MEVNKRPKASAVEVVVRVRPNTKETSSTQNIQIDSERNQVSINRSGNKGNTIFTFDKVFGPKSLQADIFNSCDHISYVLNGHNACIMAYGQTSSGKTYSMFGKQWTDSMSTISKPKASSVIDINDPHSSSSGGGGEGENYDDETFELSEDYGIVPRCIESLFSQLNTLSTSSSKRYEYTLHCHIMQIYNEKIYDLIQDKYRKNPLPVRDMPIHRHHDTTSNNNSDKMASSSSRNSSAKISTKLPFSKVHVKGLSQYPIHHQHELENLIKKGLKHRALRNTEHNVDSSRSHTIVQLFLQIEEEDEYGMMIMKKSTFSFVDLAGSEKLSTKTVNDQYLNSVQMQIQNTQKETANINSSLHVLGLCVSSLIDPNHSYIPYRNSVLTRLLQDSLTGYGHTTLIATIHEDILFLDETYSTLQFASRASKIKVQILSNLYNDSFLNNGKNGTNNAMKLTIVDARKQIELLQMRILQYELEDQKRKLLEERDKESNHTHNNTKKGQNDNNNDEDGYECYLCDELRICLQDLQTRYDTLENDYTQLKYTIDEYKDQNMLLKEKLMEYEPYHATNTHTNNSPRTAFSTNHPMESNTTRFKQLQKEDDDGLLDMKPSTSASSIISTSRIDPQSSTMNTVDDEDDYSSIGINDDDEEEDDDSDMINGIQSPLKISALKLSKVVDSLVNEAISLAVQDLMHEYSNIGNTGVKSHTNYIELFQNEDNQYQQYKDDIYGQNTYKMNMLNQQHNTHQMSSSTTINEMNPNITHINNTLFDDKDMTIPMTDKNTKSNILLSSNTTIDTNITTTCNNNLISPLISTPQSYASDINDDSNNNTVTPTTTSTTRNNDYIEKEQQQQQQQQPIDPHNSQVNTELEDNDNGNGNSNDDTTDNNDKEDEDDEDDDVLNMSMNNLIDILNTPTNKSQINTNSNHIDSNISTSYLKDDNNNANDITARNQINTTPSLSNAPLSAVPSSYPIPNTSTMFTYPAFNTTSSSSSNSSSIYSGNNSSIYPMSSISMYNSTANAVYDTTNNKTVPSHTYPYSNMTTIANTTTSSGYPYTTAAATTTPQSSYITSTNPYQDPVTSANIVNLKYQETKPSPLISTYSPYLNKLPKIFYEEDYTSSAGGPVGGQGVSYGSSSYPYNSTTTTTTTTTGYSNNTSMLPGSMYMNYQQGNNTSNMNYSHIYSNDMNGYKGVNNMNMNMASSPTNKPQSSTKKRPKKKKK